MMVLTHENTKDMTDYDLLLMCVRQYADPQNYEPYEKDYGVGEIAMRLPMIARGKGDYARDILKLIQKRKEGKQDD